MFNLKTAIKGAAAGFIISFIAGIIGRVDFFIILLRAFLSALFSGALFAGLGILYNTFLGGGTDGDFSSGVTKSSPAGSVVDITLADDELPDSDVAPDFALSPGTRLFDGASVSRQGQASTENILANNSADPAQSDVSGFAEKEKRTAESFSPVSLAAASPSAVSGNSTVEETASSRLQAPNDPISAEGKTDDYDPEKKSSIDNGGITEPVEEIEVSAENISDAGEDDALIDELPDMDGFSPGEQYYEEDDNNDTFSAVSSRSSASRSSGTESPVDISDTKNIADAIRTALKKES